MLGGKLNITDGEYRWQFLRLSSAALMSLGLVDLVHCGNSWGWGVIVNNLLCEIRFSDHFIICLFSVSKTESGGFERGCNACHCSRWRYFG